jgi:hypothetical protein
MSGLALVLSFALAAFAAAETRMARVRTAEQVVRMLAG